MALKISEEVRVQMPMKTVASLITLVAIGTWAFFGIQEKLNQHSTQLKMMGKDSDLNTEFRIKWPRGLLGSLPADSEQFMLIEELYKQMDKLQIRVDSMLHNEVGIKALDKAVEKLQKDVEKLKDKQRTDKIREKIMNETELQTDGDLQKINQHKENLLKALDDLLLETYQMEPILIDEARLVTGEEGCVCNIDIERIENDQKSGLIDSKKMSASTKEKISALIDQVLTAIT